MMKISIGVFIQRGCEILILGGFLCLSGQESEQSGLNSVLVLLSGGGSTT